MNNTCQTSTRYISFERASHISCVPADDDLLESLRGESQGHEHWPRHRESMRPALIWVPGGTDRPLFFFGLDTSEALDAEDCAGLARPVEHGCKTFFVANGRKILNNQHCNEKILQPTSR